MTLSNSQHEDHNDSLNDAIFDQLVELEHCSFPKKCETCGAVYKSVDDFVTKTEKVNGKHGLKAAAEDDGSVILEVFRNCPCGSTLLDFFADRRDISETGLKRRAAFQKVLDHLVENGIELETARAELKYYVRHKKSELLDSLGVFKARQKKRQSSK